MKALVLLSALLLAAAGPLRAQSSFRGPATVSRADSTAALQQVFCRARRGSRLSTLLFSGLLTANVTRLSQDKSTYPHLPLVLLSTTASTAGLTWNVIDWVRFSRRREAMALSQWETGQPLPRYVRKRLAFALATEATRKARH